MTGSERWWGRAVGGTEGLLMFSWSRRSTASSKRSVQNFGYVMYEFESDRVKRVPNVTRALIERAIGEYSVPRLRPSLPILQRTRRKKYSFL